MIKTSNVHPPNSSWKCSSLIYAKPLFDEVGGPGGSHLSVHTSTADVHTFLNHIIDQTLEKEVLFGRAPGLFNQLTNKVIHSDAPQIQTIHEFQT
jgi:hypothetical protein